MPVRFFKRPVSRFRRPSRASVGGVVAKLIIVLVAAGIGFLAGYVIVPAFSEEEEKRAKLEESKIARFKVELETAKDKAFNKGYHKGEGESEKRYSQGFAQGKTEGLKMGEKAGFEKGLVAGFEDVRKHTRPIILEDATDLIIINMSQERWESLSVMINVPGDRTYRCKDNIPVEPQTPRRFTYDRFKDNGRKPMPENVNIRNATIDLCCAIKGTRVINVPKTFGNILVIPIGKD